MAFSPSPPPPEYQYIRENENAVRTVLTSIFKSSQPCQHQAEHEKLPGTARKKEKPSRVSLDVKQCASGNQGYITADDIEKDKGWTTEILEKVRRKNKICACSLPNLDARNMVPQ